MIVNHRLRKTLLWTIVCFIFLFSLYGSNYIKRIVPWDIIIQRTTLGPSFSTGTPNVMFPEQIVPSFKSN
jgi:hypothetical protein